MGNLIAVIGWGSLIWDARNLRIKSRWYVDGPTLPIEFARISQNERLTLVIQPGSPDQKTLWAASACQNLAEARENLRIREGGASARDIHSLTSNGQTQGDVDPSILDKIRKWLATHPDIEAVVWTGLLSNWAERRNTEFTPERAVAYLHELEARKGETPETYNGAREYVTFTPRQIQTPVRPRVNPAREGMGGCEPV